MMNHPGQPITIHDIAEIVGSAYPLAVTPMNIVSGFKCTGIYPYNPNVFSEEDFLSSYVTDRDMEEDSREEVPVIPPPAVSATSTHVSTLSVPEEQQVASTSSVSGPAVASTSSNNEEEVSISSPTVRPEDISPFPKAGPRKRKGGRKKGKSIILTDTPVKEQLRAAQENRKQNKGKAKPKSGSKPKRLLYWYPYQKIREKV